MIRLILRVGLAAAILFIPHGLWGQLTPAEKVPWVGDTPATPPPLATDLSPELKRKNISHAMQKVADWQLARAEPGFNQDWTFAALYTGFMAVPKAANGEKYQKAMLQMAQKFNWQPGPRVPNADDAAIGQTYLDLYFRHHDPAMLAPIREREDAVMALPDNPEKPLWWWCDALFMGPPVFTKLSRATHDRKYLDFMDHQWWITSGLLYSPSNHLYFRDKSFLNKHEANGYSIFWSRGNGWVFAGLAKVLAEMPKNLRTAPLRAPPPGWAPTKPGPYLPRAPHQEVQAQRTQCTQEHDVEQVETAARLGACVRWRLLGDADSQTAPQAGRDPRRGGR